MSGKAVTLYVRGFLAGGRSIRNVSLTHSRRIIQEKQSAYNVHNPPGTNERRNDSANANVEDSDANVYMARVDDGGKIETQTETFNTEGETMAVHSLSCPHWSRAHGLLWVERSRGSNHREIDPEKEFDFVGTCNDERPRDIDSFGDVPSSFVSPHTCAKEFSWRSAGVFESDVSLLGLSSGQQALLGVSSIFPAAATSAVRAFVRRRTAVAASAGAVGMTAGKLSLAGKAAAVLLSPHVATLLAAAQVASLGTRSLQAYLNALDAVGPEGRATVALASELRRLRASHDTVRVVGHSLGAKLVVDACARLLDDERPDEVHLCALAAREDDIVDALAHGVTRPASPSKRMLPHPGDAVLGSCTPLQVIYYSPKDTLLATAFRLVHEGAYAVGCTGLRTDGIVAASAAERTSMVDASPHLDLGLAHWQFKSRLPRFAIR